MKVYISTNLEQPANCFEGLADKARINALVGGLNNNKIVKTTEDVFLVSDDLDRIEINKDECCLLFHSKTKGNFINAFNHKTVGMHVQDKNRLYAPVFSILLDTNKNDQKKLSEIIEILGFTKDEIEENDTLEAKLDFLHLCSTPEGINQAELKAEWNAQEEFGALENVISEGSFGENYIKALRVLRDKLLGH